MRVEFIAYAGDCRVAGATTLAEGERLTDLLNRELTIVVDGARLTSHADGHTVEVGEIALERDDLFAIEALGPRRGVAQDTHDPNPRCRHRSLPARGARC
jgi:hypothetical protein